MGREAAVYDLSTDKLKMINLYGSQGAIGRIDVTWNGSTPNYNKVYYIKDHLGSIRRVVNTSGTIVNANEYYAYGDLAQSYTSGSGNNKYKFTGKERDTETNYDYFGARYYDSDLGRWLSVDPLAGKYPGLSPYNYTLNNPIKFIDPTGMETEWSEDDLYYNLLGGGNGFSDLKLGWRHNPEGGDEKNEH